MGYSTFSRAPLHTRDWEPVTIFNYTSSTLIGGKGGAGLISSLHTTLEGATEYANARWMSSLHGFLRGIKWIMFHGHLDPFLGGRPNTKPSGDNGTLNAHNCWFILFYRVWGPAWIEVHWHSIWLRARSHMTSHYTWGCVTTLHDFGGVLGTAFGHLLLGSHNFTVTALGSCVKWP